jgi:hypothetical protein
VKSDLQYIPKWLFQATADRYDLRSEFMEGRGECWPSIQHRDTPFRLGEDQRAIFFRAHSREFYGIGRILSVRRCLRDTPEHTQDIGVDVSYDKRFFPSIRLPPPADFSPLDWDNESLPRLFTEGFQGALFSITQNDWSNINEICPRLRTELSLDNYPV